MRAEISFEGQFIWKRSKVTPAVAEALLGGLQAYSLHLNVAGLLVPQTEVSFDGEELLMKQRTLGGESADVDGIIRVIKAFDYSYYGLDPNPGNFLTGLETSADDVDIEMAREIYFVDFVPFLAREENILAAQFDYEVEAVLQRYFTVENALATYAVRLGLRTQAPQLLATALPLVAPDLLAGFDVILPREKLRLLELLRVYDIAAHAEPSGLSSFADIYRATKSITQVSAEQEFQLQSRLESFSL